MKTLAFFTILAYWNLGLTSVSCSSEPPEGGYLEIYGQYPGQRWLESTYVDQDGKAIESNAPLFTPTWTDAYNNGPFGDINPYDYARVMPRIMLQPDAPDLIGHDGDQYCSLDNAGSSPPAISDGMAEIKITDGPPSLPPTRARPADNAQVHPPRMSKPEGGEEIEVPSRQARQHDCLQNDALPPTAIPRGPRDELKAESTRREPMTSRPASRGGRSSPRHADIGSARPSRQISPSADTLEKMNMPASMPEGLPKMRHCQDPRLQESGPLQHQSGPPRDPMHRRIPIPVDEMPMDPTRGPTHAPHPRNRGGHSIQGGRGTEHCPPIPMPQDRSRIRSEDPLEDTASSAVRRTDLNRSAPDRTERPRESPSHRQQRKGGASPRSNTLKTSKMPLPESMP